MENWYILMVSTIKEPLKVICFMEKGLFSIQKIDQRILEIGHRTNFMVRVLFIIHLYLF